MNGTSWQYVGWIAAGSAALVGIGGLVSPVYAPWVVLWLAIGVAFFGNWLTTHAYRKLKGKKWTVSVTGADWSKPGYYKVLDSFPGAMSEFLIWRCEVETLDATRAIQITASDGSFFCWNNPDYLDLTEFGGARGKFFKPMEGFDGRMG